MTEDDEPMVSTPLLAPLSLERLGVAELESYISGLHTEIARATAEMVRKKDLRTAAASVFKR